MKKIKRFVRKNQWFLILVAIFLGGFFVRLYKVDSPLADWHSWRQADTASVSKIFKEEGINLLYPKYHDISSIQTGVDNPQGLRFVEFPLFNLLHVILSSLLPSLSFEVAGRLVSIFSSLFSAFFLYFIGKKFMGKVAGLLTSFFFLFLPFNIYFSRVILPEPLAVSLAVGSLWYGVSFIDTGKPKEGYLASILFSLSLLVKPFTLFYAFPLLYWGYKNPEKIRQSLSGKRLFSFLAIAFLPFILWRLFISQYPEGIPHWKWAFNGDKIRFRPSFWRWIFGERLGRLILGIWGLVPFVFGFLKTHIFVYSFLAGVAAFVFTFATANVRHDYYQIIVIPAIALILAQGSVILWKKFKVMGKLTLIFSLSMMFLVSAKDISGFYKINSPQIVTAGERIDEIAEKDALVVAPYNGDTAFLYQTCRRGWPVIDSSIDELIKKGADYYVSVNLIDRDTLDIKSRFQVIEETNEYMIVDLRERK